MPEIAIVVNSNVIPATIALKIHSILDIGIKEVNKRVKDKNPILREELFMNNHEEIVSTLKQIIMVLGQTETSYKMYELETGDACDDIYEIDMDTLINIDDYF